jgi:hypothetical protein
MRESVCRYSGLTVGSNTSRYLRNMLTVGLCLLNSLEREREKPAFKNKAFIQSQDCPGVNSSNPFSISLRGPGSHMGEPRTCIGKHCPDQARWPGPRTCCMWGELGRYVRNRREKATDLSVQIEKGKTISKSRVRRREQRDGRVGCS